jgi:hypothetical protein
VLVNNEDIPIATSKQGSFGVEFKRNKLNVELTGFYKIVEALQLLIRGFYNNFQYKMHKEVTRLKESNFWPIKRQEDSVLELVTLQH